MAGRRRRREQTNTRTRCTAEGPDYKRLKTEGKFPTGCEVCKELKPRMRAVIEEDLITLITQQKENTQRILKPLLETVESQLSVHKTAEAFIHTDNADLLKEFEGEAEDELRKYLLVYSEPGDTIKWGQYDTNHVKLSVGKRYHPQGASAHSPRTVIPRAPTATVQAASYDTSATHEEQLTLSLQQVQILKRAGEQILLFGPPKTGKTRLLIHVTKAKLDRDVPVLILSTWDGSLASSKFIQHKAKILTGKEATLIHFVLFDDAVAEIVDKAVALARDHKLYVIADEAHDGPAFEKLCNGLHKKIPNVHIWAAASKHKNVPKQMTKELLTEPQGNQAPHIQQLMGRAGFFRDGSTENYTGTTTDASEAVTTKMSTRSTVELSQGDPDKQLPHQGTGHDALEPKNCEQCGKDIATALGELGVNSKERPNTALRTFSFFCGVTPILQTQMVSTTT